MYYRHRYGKPFWRYDPFYHYRVRNNNRLGIIHKMDDFPKRYLEESHTDKNYWITGKELRDLLSQYSYDELFTIMSFIEGLIRQYELPSLVSKDHHLREYETSENTQSSSPPGIVGRERWGRINELYEELKDNR